MTPATPVEKASLCRRQVWLSVPGPGLHGAWSSGPGILFLRPGKAGSLFLPYHAGILPGVQIATNLSRIKDSVRQGDAGALAAQVRSPHLEAASSQRNGCVLAAGRPETGECFSRETRPATAIGIAAKASHRSERRDRTGLTTTTQARAGAAICVETRRVCQVIP